MEGFVLFFILFEFTLNHAFLISFLQYSHVIHWILILLWWYTVSLSVLCLIFVITYAIWIIIFILCIWIYLSEYSALSLTLSCWTVYQGAPPCTYYAQHGVCKFGPTCKFDHPMGALSYSPSASSLADMPVAPYPVGSSIGTLAPSSSSSELRPELMSSRLSSSMSSSGGSVGSIFSKSGSVSQSSVPTTAGSSSSHGGEPRSSS